MRLSGERERRLFGATVSAPDELYVLARHALLDALTALGEHRQALILVGAQLWRRSAAHRRWPRLPRAPTSGDPWNTNLMTGVSASSFPRAEMVGHRTTPWSRQE